MRKCIITQLLMTALIVIMAAGCRSVGITGAPAPGYPVGKGLPPGQAKKVYGHQSAKAFAPGQQSKHAGAYKTQGNGKKYKKDKKNK